METTNSNHLPTGTEYAIRWTYLHPVLKETGTRLQPFFLRLRSASDTPERREQIAETIRKHKPSDDLMVYRFRVYDDDNELYASGQAYFGSKCTQFEPLDIAMGWWGCTRIDYFDPIWQEWRIL